MAGAVGRLVGCDTAVQREPVTHCDTSPVLRGIEQIDWSKHNHAFGPADDLPRLLHDVASGGAAADRAVSDLFGTIWHQGTVYDASSVAVPFLGELAASNDVDVEIRYLLLALIFAIGRGKGYWQVHARAGSRHGHLPADLATVLEAESRTVRACRQAVQQVANELLENLSTWPDRLWLSVVGLVVVAGEVGSALLDGVVAEASRRLPPFGAVGVATIAELVTLGTTSSGQVDALAALDSELADFVEDFSDGGGLDLSLDSYFVDVLVERLCDTNGGGDRV